MLETTSLLATFVVALILRLRGKRKIIAWIISCSVIPTFIAIAELFIPYFKGSYASAWLYSLIFGSICGMLAGGFGVAFASYIIKQQARNIYIGATFILLLAIFSFSIVLKSNECNRLSNKSLTLVKPIVSAVGSDKLYDLIEELQLNQTPEADEALSYLVNVYIGEHSGGMILCETINRGNRVLSTIIDYKECTPKVDAMPFIPERRKISILANEAIEEIRKGEKCEH